MSAGEAARSFLSFARGAMRTETLHKYESPASPVARHDAVYSYLRGRPDFPPGIPDPPTALAPIWHLLSWVVVALEAHLTAEPISEPTCKSAGRPSEPSEEEIRVVAIKVTELWGPLGIGSGRSHEQKAEQLIRALDEYRARKAKP